MPTKPPCPSCAHPNEPGARFCTGCGVNLEPRQHCPSCAAVEPLSNQFCSQCGAEMGTGAFAAGREQGTMHEGVWKRGADEFIRRVEPDECRTFLGSRVMVVPAGTVGLITVDGVVQEVLPPGQRTTANIFERVADFFTGKSQRTALFLVDQRPIPVPFVVTTRATADGRQIQTQVLVTFFLPRGDRDRMGRFLDTVLGDRASMAAADLYDLLRPEVSRTATIALERLANTATFGYPEAEGTIRDALESVIGARYGLGVSVTVAPLTTTASINVQLGLGQAPRVRPCVSCQAELPAALGFCDRCGTRQPTVTAPDRSCSSCRASVADGHAFCDACGAAFVAPSATFAPLFTRDGEQVEVDLVIRVTGQHGELTGERLAPALVGAAAGHLRTVDFSTLSTESGFAAMEAAMKPDCEAALAAHGLTLSVLSVLDARTKRGNWLLGARSDLARAEADLGLGREWLAQRAGDIDLQALALAQGLRQHLVERGAKLETVAADLTAGRREEALHAEDRFERDQAALADRERRERLAGVDAALDGAEAKRRSVRDRAVAAAEREVEGDTRAHSRAVDLENLEHDMGKEWRTFEHQSGLTRGAAELEAERRRQGVTLTSEAARAAAEDAAHATRSAQDATFADHERRARLDVGLEGDRQAQQLEKLRVMADLDRNIAAQEAEREQARIAALKGIGAREALALQAAELAKTDSGAAFAAAIGQLGGAETEALRREDAERHAAELRAIMEGQNASMQAAMQAQLDRMTRLAEKAAGDPGPANERVYSTSMDAMARVASAKVSPSATVAAVAVPGGAEDLVPCTSCSASLRRGAKFCGTCGTAQ